MDAMQLRTAQDELTRMARMKNEYQRRLKELETRATEEENRASSEVQRRMEIEEEYASLQVRDILETFI